jgi:hypothetical protein
MADPTQEQLASATPSPQPPPDLPEGTIHLRIKVPHGNLPPSVSASTFSLGAVPVTARVGDIRRQIQQTIPSNPAITRQRLLYGGRSLYDDTESLQDALNTRRNSEQKEYVIHLIVRAEAGVDGRTASPARAQTPSAAQLHQNALQQHQQLHQRLHQHNVALGQQAPFPETRNGNLQNHAALNYPVPFPQFGLPGMQGPHAMPMQAQIVNPQDPAAIQRMMQQQAQLHTGQAANGQPSHAHPAAQAENNMPSLPSGTGDQNTVNTSSASAPPPASESQDQGSAGQRQPGETPARPQTQPPQQAQPPPHQGPMNNFRAEVRGPNGEVWEYHQHTINIPHGHGSGYAMTSNVPPQQGQLGQAPRPLHFGPLGWAPAMPGMPQINMPHMPMPAMGMPLQNNWPLQMGQPQAAGAHNRGPSLPGGSVQSALDRARNDLAEIRRSLNELRLLTHAAMPNEEEERRTLQMISQLEQRARDLESYIDPFALGGAASASSAGAANAGPQNGTNPAPSRRLPPLRQRLGPLGGFSALNAPTPTTNNQDITAYLLSSPQGPQAIIYSPEYGTYTTATQPRSTPTTSQPSTTEPQQRGNQQPPRDPAAQEAAHRAIQDFAAQRLAGAQAIAAGGNPMGGAQEPLQQLMGHFWLLLRILIFAYFLMGSNMGLTKLVLLAVVGVGFWVLRLGVLGNAEVMARVRRWWEGVMGVPQRHAQAPADQVQQVQGLPAAEPAAQGPGQGNRMPTPEQVAQRLLDDNAAQNRGWLREQIRPIERAVALFVASLWPGIGEAHVRAQREAREAEERRAAEAEVEARRRAEDEAAEKQDGEGSSTQVDQQGENGGDGNAERAVQESGEAQKSAEPQVQ